MERPYQLWYTGDVVNHPRLRVRFYSDENGAEPVREWLRSMPSEDRKRIGADILTVQFRWPIGLPWTRNLGRGLWEVRTSLENSIARVLFVIDSGEMILVHGFIKKTEQTPAAVLDIARTRAKALRRKT